MDKPALRELLISRHGAFLNDLHALTPMQMVHTVNGKWSPAQQLEHIIKSVSPVALAFRMPGFLLRWIFGTSNRPSRNFEELVARYHQKLAAGGKSSKPFVPGPAPNSMRQQEELKLLVETLCVRINNFSEDQLDTLLLPHPLLGKLTLREMLYFTGYHVTHHHQQVLAHLKS